MYILDFCSGSQFIRDRVQVVLERHLTNINQEIIHGIYHLDEFHTKMFSEFCIKKLRF